MTARRNRLAPVGPFLIILVLVMLLPLKGLAAPYAAMVMDARTGEVLHSENADARLHPASLTKMMTLYMVFEALEAGELSLTETMTASAEAASRPASHLGLSEGDEISVEDAIRALIVQSANDVAVVRSEEHTSELQSPE